MDKLAATAKREADAVAKKAELEAAEAKKAEREAAAAATKQLESPRSPTSPTSPRRITITLETIAGKCASSMSRATA